jgi:hypothetical protein
MVGGEDHLMSASSNIPASPAPERVRQSRCDACVDSNGFVRDMADNCEECDFEGTIDDIHTCIPGKRLCGNCRRKHLARTEGQSAKMATEERAKS